MSIDWKNGKLVKLSAADESSFFDLIEPLMLENERILATYKGVRDGLVLTDHNMIVINVQEVTGKKKSLALVPYASVSIVESETAGLFDIDSGIKLHIHGGGSFKLEFTRGTDVRDIQAIITRGILGYL